jgi:hypothetical protein
MLAIEEQEDYRQLSAEQRKEHLKDESLLAVRLDNYVLPSLLQKMIKSMKKNQVAELTTTRVDKLHTNFVSEFLDQYKAFKAGDLVTIVVSLYGIEHTSYFYKLTIAKKLEYVRRLKDTAGKFFKLQNFRKAAKIYQKINGYYSFGDTGNNFQKEDDSSDHFKKCDAELGAEKVNCFSNLVVCKNKLGEHQSVIAITDQLLAMAPNHAKALFFRGKAFIAIKEFD